jgi:Nitrate/nitrite transporter
MFCFMLLHQADKLLIGPLTTQIMDTFKISRTQMGAVTTGALIVGAIFYPIWGWLYDKFSRPKTHRARVFSVGSIDLAQRHSPQLTRYSLPHARAPASMTQATPGSTASFPTIIRRKSEVRFTDFCRWPSLSATLSG